MDIIPVVTALNMKFQREDLDISMIGPSVRLTMHELDVLTKNSESMKQLDDEIISVDGKHSFKGVEITLNAREKSSFRSASYEFVEKLKENLERRFPSETLSLTTAAEVIALKGLPFVSKEEVIHFGNDKLKLVADHFGSPKKLPCGTESEPVINNNEVMDEWKLL